MAYRIILRRDGSTNWESQNPVLLLGEPGYETDTGKFKIGDGSSTWTQLNYYIGATGATGSVDLTSVSSDIIPSEDRTYDIGATGPGNRWRNGYFQTVYVDQGTLYIGDVPISATDQSILIDSIILGGPTGSGGVLLSANNGSLTSDGSLIIGPTGATGRAGVTGPSGVTGPAGATGPAGSGGIIERTYSQLYSGLTGGNLSAGSYYLITDFRTCYDQPDFDQNGNSIVGGSTYKTGNVEPIIVLATSSSTISSQAFSVIYPLDQIQYDIEFNQTERTSSPAKGRITERIDERGNRTDYDFREVLFKRYDFYYSENYYEGLLSIDGSGVVTGTNTLFTSIFNVGDILGVSEGTYSVPLGCFRYYEILTIDSDTSMTVTGKTINSMSNVRFSKGISFGSPRNFCQTNIASNTTSDEFKTFAANDVFNVKIGNFADLYDWQEYPFILSNNVFFNGSYEDITIGDESYDNTFDDDMNALSFGNNCYRNTITNDFDRNTVGNYFRNNIIICDMADNHIGNSFEYNMLGDNDGGDFDQNRIGNYFQSNFITFANNNFRNNNIGDYFNDNVINEGFENNLVIGNFYNNLLVNSFYDNTVGFNFYLNSFDGQVYDNQIGNNFYSNVAGNNFSYNTIRNNFYSNTIGSNFSSNQIGDYFNNNNIGDNFGYGYSATQSNIIGNNFQNNTIGEYCYNNRISDNFMFNSTANYFQWNDIRAVIQETNLYSCILYSTTNVNLFKNQGGDIRLSYFDASDVLTIESLNEVVCVSFTITSSDFTFGDAINSSYTTALGTNGIEGFDNTSPTNLGNGYYGNGLTGASLTQLTEAYNILGLSLTNSVGYIWNVEWGAGSTITNGVAKFGAYVNSTYFDIQPIDTTDPSYLTPNSSSGTSLTGTFKFPATFTAFVPLTNKGGWC